MLNSLLQVDGKFVKMHLYDTSGMTSFLWLAKKHMEEADGFAFVYDVTDMTTLTSLESWHALAQRCARAQNLPKLLVGNKADLRHKQVVGASTAREFGIPEGMVHIEVSAQRGKCLNLGFYLLASEILKHRKLGTVQRMGQSTNLAIFTSDDMFEEQPLERPLVAARDDEEYAHLFKIMLVGAPRSGKTSLRFRFCNDHYSAEYIATAGFDYSKRSILIDNERVCVQVWDVAGDEVYNTTRHNYYKGANGFIVLYDVSHEESFTKAERLLKELDMAGMDSAPKILVGNKCDVRKQQVDFSVVKDFADGWRIPVLEASARYGTNVDSAFMKVIFALKRQLAPWKRLYNWS